MTAGSYHGDFHLLAEEGEAIHKASTQVEADEWRKEMRRLARGKFNIRTGDSDANPLIVWAWRMDTRAGESLRPLRID